MLRVSRRTIRVVALGLSSAAILSSCGSADDIASLDATAPDALTTEEPAQLLRSADDLVAWDDTLYVLKRSELHQTGEGSEREPAVIHAFTVDGLQPEEQIPLPTVDERELDPHELIASHTLGLVLVSSACSSLPVEENIICEDSRLETHVMKPPSLTWERVGPPSQLDGQTFLSVSTAQTSDSGVGLVVESVRAGETVKDVVRLNGDLQWRVEGALPPEATQSCFTADAAYGLIASAVPGNRAGGGPPTADLKLTELREGGVATLTLPPGIATGFGGAAVTIGCTDSFLAIASVASSPDPAARGAFLARWAADDWERLDADVPAAASGPARMLSSEDGVGVDWGTLERTSAGVAIERAVAGLDADLDVEPFSEIDPGGVLVERPTGHEVLLYESVQGYDNSPDGAPLERQPRRVLTWSGAQ